MSRLVYVILMVIFGKYITDFMVWMNYMVLTYVDTEDYWEKW